MPGLTLTPTERRDLAARIGLDPWTMTAAGIAQRLDEMKRRGAERMFADDPTGIIHPDSESAGLPPLDTRAMADDAADRALDAAVARGAIGPEERPAWKRQYEKAPETVGEVLASLPSDPASAERARADERTVARLDELTGVSPADRVREFADDGDPTGILGPR